MLQIEVLAKGDQDTALIEMEDRVEEVRHEVRQEVRQEVRRDGWQEQVQEEQGMDERVEQGEAEELEAVDESLVVTNESNETEIRFIKGKGNKNLGKLISGNQQFVCNKRIKCKSEEGGTTYYYDCARKHEGKGQGPGSSCKARAIVKTNDIGEDVEVVKMAKLTDHNHICDHGRVLKWLLYEELEKTFLMDLMQKPSEVRKKVIGRFREKYRTQSDVLDQLDVLLTEDPNIDRHLNALRHKTLGNLPKSRDAIRVDHILKVLQEDGGQNVKLLDSNEMWLDPEFRRRFSDEYQARGAPPRAMLFTSEKLLEQMATVTRCPSFLQMQYWTPFCPPPFPPSSPKCLSRLYFLGFSILTIDSLSY